MNRRPLLFVVCLLLLVGCSQNSSGAYDDGTISKARATVESYLIHNYKDIDQIKFDKDTTSPMGGMMISGIVNGNEKATFSIDVEVENDFSVGSIGKGKEFPERKKECIDKTCDY
ncbi:DUF1433 domain-containing protein [Bacillus sp. RAR_GA_16]|uniref:DUF1433 domain-containing protein n=1 Tax=Bacillus sp. RAR_GA_16 TaxID=2876774 RepID=UPI001CCBACC9|nr:DUF1433 domain-containing protein [Bacillus sp. RAR_GA_16]MCA0172988.1 DUF1433 domain-containing protein [Bacillus sp. RAR_GA_16]